MRLGSVSNLKFMLGSVESKKGYLGSTLVYDKTEEPPEFTANPQYVSHTSIADKTEPTTSVFSTPSGTQVGDFLVLMCNTYKDSSAAAHTLPEPFASGAIGTPQEVLIGLGDIIAHNTLSVWRVDTTPDSNYTVTHGSDVAWTSGALIRISGNGVLSVDVSYTDSGTGGDVETPGVTTTEDNDLLLFLCAKHPSNAVDPPSGMTERHDPTEPEYFATQVLGAAGATGARNAYPPGLSNHWVRLLAVKDVAP